VVELDEAENINLFDKDTPANPLENINLLDKGTPGNPVLTDVRRLKQAKQHTTVGANEERSVVQMGVYNLTERRDGLRSSAKTDVTPVLPHTYGPSFRRGSKVIYSVFAPIA